MQTLHLFPLIILSCMLLCASAFTTKDSYVSSALEKSPFTRQDYLTALRKSLLFFEGQRSGKLPRKQRVRWRGDSGLSDGFAAKVNLVGGYYDAGDNVKFGLPMAFTTTLLAWSVIEFGSSMQNQVKNATYAVRWGSNYLLKAATATPGSLYVQVGNANNDHQCWERPEDMDTPRDVYKVSANSPGSDVAAETAAALAASSIVFKYSDPFYSKRLLKAAINVFKLADEHRGAYSDSLGSAVCPFYCSHSGYKDELLWGAAWIYQATKSRTYLSYIQYNGRVLGGEDNSNWFSWDDKRPATKILLAKSFLEARVQGLQDYKTRSDNYICSLIPGSPNFQSQYTPGGLLYKAPESNLQYVTSSSLLLLTYAKYLDKTHGVVHCGSTRYAANKLRALAKKQVDYILGDNPQKRSYMVGFGKNFPKHVHHRGASIPSIHKMPNHIGCSDGFQYLHKSEEDQNILVGAIVGGPDSNDNFSDNRDNYRQTEPATYINAPFVGLAAYFSSAA
ncbi:Endoglucanase [Heracleum sosnowskyi]|uniref:Endoglucanase n=1 Tax=Heracleum sosnowskyi TaxID=360622 RepID=A0AAD8ID82_9APIA|nr:Endoglucanase [Heracleum sosnowskyi]